MIRIDPSIVEKPPEISVVMPVLNGAAFLERALRSVIAQSYDGWELVVVDDASTDETPSLLTTWADRDQRIRAFRLDSIRGPSAARNYALHRARGSTITYLDSDDEYYPDYLMHVHTHRDKADVLVFAYDAVDAGEGTLPRGELMTWDPGLVRAQLLERNITNPLGVAHRRSLLDEAGYFDEVVYLLEDWLLWRRFALAGARFLFLHHKSGRYHVRPDSLSRTRRMPQALRVLEEVALTGKLLPGADARGNILARDPFRALGGASEGPQGLPRTVDLDWSLDDWPVSQRPARRLAPVRVTLPDSQERRSELAALPGVGRRSGTRNHCRRHRLAGRHP